MIGTIHVIGFEAEGAILFLMGQGSFQRWSDSRRAMEDVCDLDGKRERSF